MARLAVGIDAANLLHDRRGMGRYVRGLLRAWLSSLRDRVEPTLLVPHLFPQLVARRLSAQFGGSVLKVARRNAAGSLGLDVVLFPWNGMTWRTPTKSVVTIHDLWPFVEPEPSPHLRVRQQRHYRAGAASADRFIAVSEFTKAEAVKYLRVDPIRVDVVPEGVEPLTKVPSAPASFNGFNRYVLFVGENEPRKDVATLMRAMAVLPEPVRSTTGLVVVGRQHETANVSQGDGIRVEFTGEVDDDRLASLYSGAAVFAFPSRYEGFGLPVLEAMECGTPVVAADAASIPEVARGAALLFPAGDAGALAAALTRVLTDGIFAKRLSEAGRTRAAEMTTELCARRTLEVLERVAGR